MIHKSQLQFTLVIALVMSLIAYHITNIFIPELYDDIFASFKNDFFIILKIAQYIVIAIIFYKGINANWLTRFLLGKNYIGESKNLL